MKGERNARFGLLKFPTQKNTKFTHKRRRQPRKNRCTGALMLLHNCCSHLSDDPSLHCAKVARRPHWGSTDGGVDVGW